MCPKKIQRFWFQAFHAFLSSVGKHRCSQALPSCVEREWVHPLLVQGLNASSSQKTEAVSFRKIDGYFNNDPSKMV